MQRSAEGEHRISGTPDMRAAAEKVADCSGVPDR